MASVTIVQRLMAQPMLRRVGTLMSGTLAGQLIVLAVMPLLTRIYQPEAFNDFGIYTAITSVFAVLASLRLNAAIPIAQSDQDAAGLTVICLWSSVLVAGLAFATTWIMLSMTWVNVLSDHFIFSVVVGVSVLLVGTFQALTALQIRQDGYENIARAKTYQGVGLAAGQVALGLLTPVPVALTVGDVVGRFVGLPQLRSGIKNIPKLTFAQQVGLVRERYIQFPKYSLPAAGINSLGSQMPVLLLGVYFAPALVGLYVFANRMIAIPISLIAWTLSQVYLGDLGKAQAAGRPIMPVFRRYLLVSFVITAMGVGVALALIPWLVPVLFGEEWRDSIPLFNYLALLALVQVPSSTVSQTLNAVGRNSWQLCWDMLRVTIVFLAIHFGNYFYESMKFAVILHIVTAALLYIILIVVCNISINYADRCGSESRGVRAKSDFT